jgi:hypothetical protein
VILAIVRVHLKQRVLTQENLFIAVNVMLVSMVMAIQSAKHVLYCLMTRLLAMRTIVLVIPGTLVMVSHVHTINTTNAMLRRTRRLLDGRLATILATTTLEDVKIPEIHLLVPLVMTDIEVMESHA